MEILGGPFFGVAAAGESHGPAVTTIVFGCPPGLRISRRDLQTYLDRRRPGGSRHATTRREADRVVLLAGLYQEDAGRLLSGPHVRVQTEDGSLQTRAYEEGYSTGEPIAAIVLSTSGKPQDYAQFSGPAGEVRPGHTDLVKWYKSRGFVDVRGGGRSSYRSTISDVIGGSVARIFLAEHFGTAFLSSVCQVGTLRASLTLADRLDQLLRTDPGPTVSGPEIDRLQTTLGGSEIPSLDGEFAGQAAELIRTTRAEGDSLGAAVEVVAVNVPPLLGDPLYQSLKVRLMGVLGGLHAAQCCEIGAGHDVVSRRGSQNNDPIRRSGYQSNSHGGLIGGITTGRPLVFRVGFKPTSSIAKAQPSVRKNLEEIEFRLKAGRHDPCVGIRAGITLESRMAVELLNAVLAHQAGHIDPDIFKLF